MSDFEEYIKLNYPRDYERQKRIYLDQSMEDLYSEDYKMWQHQQSKIDELQKRIDEYKKLTTSIRNEFDLWSDDSEFADIIEAQIENLEGMRGDE